MSPLFPRPHSLAFGMAMLYSVGGSFLPFITLYLQDKGLSYEEIGNLFIACSIAGTATPFLWGYAADRWVSAERLLRGLFLGTALLLGLLTAQDSALGLGVCLAATFALYQPTSTIFNALIYHHLSSPEREFGRLRLCGSLGWMVPSLLIHVHLAVGPEVSRDLTFVVRIAGVLALVMALTTCLLPATPPGRQRSREGQEGELPYRAALRRLILRPGFIPFLFVIFLVHSSFAVLFYYSPPFLEAAGFGREWIGPLQCIGVAVEVPFLLLLPRVIGRLGYHGTITFGCAMLFLRQLLYAASAPAWMLAASYVLAGACVAFYLTTVSLALNAMADRSVRATAQAMFAIVGPGLGQMCGHKTVGWIADRSASGLAAGFACAAGTAGAALILLGALRKTGLFLTGVAPPPRRDSP